MSSSSCGNVDQNLLRLSLVLKFPIEKNDVFTTERYELENQEIDALLQKLKELDAKL